MDREALVEIEYWAKGKMLVKMYSAVYPNYRVGDSLALNYIPTNRERQRRPKHDFTQQFCVIEKVHHEVQQSHIDENLFTPKLEVYLIDLSEIDTNSPEIDTTLEIASISVSSSKKELLP